MNLGVLSYIPNYVELAKPVGFVAPGFLQVFSGHDGIVASGSKYQPGQ